MDKENQEKFSCADGDEYSICCVFRVNFEIDRYYNNHLKLQTHINSFRKRQKLNNTNISSSFFFK